MSAFNEETVLSIHHWTDRLFTFKTTRDPSLRFSNGHFTMIGLRVNEKPLLRAYSIVSANYEEHLEFLSIKVADGPLTSRLQHIKVGDKIIVGRKPTGTLLIDYLLPGKRLFLLSTGTGLAPDMLKSIFEMFVQVSGTSRDAQGGLGIGLTLVKSLVELQGGSIEATSEGLGRGATFTVRLPLAKSTSVSRRRSRVSQDGWAPSIEGTILVVDDNRDAADSLAELLGTMGATALVAYGGSGPLHAVAIARELGIPRVLVPPSPSTFSAWGMLATDLRHDLVRTVLEPIEATDAAWADARYREMQAEMKCTSIVVTHDMESAFRISDRIAMLANHTIVQTGTVEEMKASDHESVRAFFDAHA